MDKRQYSNINDYTVLPLVLTYKWYDLIDSGEKKEEYRVAKPFWDKRFAKWVWDSTDSKKPMVVAFQRAYNKPTMWFLCQSVHLLDKSYHPFWGEPNALHWVLQLGKRLYFTMDEKD